MQSSGGEILGQRPCRNRRASQRIVGGLVVSLFTFWQAATLIGWDIYSLVLITWIWWAVWNLNAEECKRHANREDPSLRLTELMVLSAGVALLVAVAQALIRAGNATGVPRPT